MDDGAGNGGDNVDSAGIPGGDGHDSKPGNGGDAGAPIPESIFLAEEEYKMNYPERGWAVIINNRDFDPKTGMGSRTGTDLDASKIYQRLQSLEFRVEMFINQSKTEMKNIMMNIAKKDHSGNDCFACVILSHGEEGAVYGRDGPLEIKELTDPIKGHRCPSLAGKPKLFFIQACRGQGLDDGQVVADALGTKGGGEEDMEEEVITYRIPTEADFLMAYSVVPGYFSWRNSLKGSWFMQALCTVLEEFGTQLDIMTMMTRVNKIVAYEFESNASKEFMNRKKQIPCITSMLTKYVYFRTKN